MTALVLALMLATGGSTREIATDPFRGVALETPATVRVEPASHFRVTAEGDPRAVRCVIADVRDGRLVLGWSGITQSRRHGRTRDDAILVDARTPCGKPVDAARLSVHVEAPAIDGVSIGDHGSITVAPMASTAFAASIPGEGHIVLEGLKSETVRLAIGGNGSIAAAGDIGQLDISIGGSGTIDARRAHGRSAKVWIGGHGDVAATVDGPAGGAIGGSGKILIAGHPVCSFRKLGGGTITCPAG